MSGLRGGLRAAYTIWARDMLRFARDRSSLFSSLGQPLFFFVVFGFGLAPVIPNLGGGAVTFQQFLYPGILAMVVLFTAVFSAVSLVVDRQFGFLKGVLAAPVPRAALALGKVAAGTTVALVQGVLMLALAPLLGLRLGWAELGLAAGLILLLGGVMTALGLLMAVRQRTIAGFHLLMNFILLPMFFLSGAFYPLQGVPGWMRALAVVDPVTYGVDPLRRVLLAGSIPPAVAGRVSLFPPYVDVLVLGAFGILFLALSVRLFSQTEDA